MYRCIDCLPGMCYCIQTQRLPTVTLPICGLYVVGKGVVMHAIYYFSINTLLVFVTFLCLVIDAIVVCQESVKMLSCI